MLSNAVFVIFDWCSLLLLVALTFHLRSNSFSPFFSGILPPNCKLLHFNSLEFWSLPSLSAKVVKCLQTEIWDDLEAHYVFLFFFRIAFSLLSHVWKQLPCIWLVEGKSSVILMIRSEKINWVLQSKKDLEGWTSQV